MFGLLDFEILKFQDFSNFTILQIIKLLYLRIFEILNFMILESTQSFLFANLPLPLFLCNSSPSLKLESVSEMMVSLSRSPSAAAAALAGALGEGVGTIFGSGVATAAGCAFNVPRETPRGGGAGAGGLAFFAERKIEIGGRLVRGSVGKGQANSNRSNRAASGRE